MCNKNIEVVLSKKDVEKLREAYDNYNISIDYLYVDVKNIMLYEGIDKSQALKKILTFIYNI